MAGVSYVKKKRRAVTGTRTPIKRDGSNMNSLNEIGRKKTDCRSGAAFCLGAFIMPDLKVVCQRLNLND